MSERIYFGTIKEGIEPPNLIEVQLNSYVDFLQKDVPFSKRKNSGLQAVFKEVFPIESYDEKATLDFSLQESKSLFAFSTSCFACSRSRISPVMTREPMVIFSVSTALISGSG